MAASCRFLRFLMCLWSRQSGLYVKGERFLFSSSSLPKRSLSFLPPRWLETCLMWCTSPANSSTPTTTTQAFHLISGLSPSWFFVLFMLKFLLQVFALASGVRQSEEDLCWMCSGKLSSVLFDWLYCCYLFMFNYCSFWWGGVMQEWQECFQN